MHTKIEKMAQNFENNVPALKAKWEQSIKNDDSVSYICEMPRAIMKVVVSQYGYQLDFEHLTAESDGDNPVFNNYKTLKGLLNRISRLIDVFPSDLRSRHR